MDGKRIVLLLGLAAPLVVMLLCDAWTTGAPLTFASGTVTGDDGRPRTIDLPYVTDDEPSAAGPRSATEPGSAAEPGSATEPGSAAADSRAARA